MNVGIGQIGTRVNIFLHGTFPKLVFLIFDAPLMRFGNAMRLLRCVFDAPVMRLMRLRKSLCY